MSEIAVERINVAELLGSKQGAADLAKVEAAITSDPEVGLLVKAAETVEDVYEIVKRFSTATFEQVKVLFDKTVDYFKESKAVLSDELLDNVVGGGLFEWWDKYKTAVIGGVIMVGCMAVGAVIGSCVAGPAGTLGGVYLGIAVGGSILAGIDAAMKK